MKRIISLALVAILALTALVGCGKEKAFDYSKADLTKYVTLGKYTGIEVEVADAALTDEDIDGALKDLLTENGETVQIKDRAVADGDKVNIDYVGKKDGVAFDGGTAKGASLEIGSDSYIDGFEDGLVGVMPGATVDLNLTFPNPYQNNPDLAGAAVVFTVTVNYIDELKLPEWNDEFVNTLTKGEYKTTAAYLEVLKAKWADEKKAEIENKKISDVWQAVLKNCTIIEYPQSELDKYYADIIASYESYATQYNIDLDTFLSYMGTDRAELEAYANDYAHSLVAEELVYHSIVKAEGLELGQEELDAGIASYAEYYNMSVEDLKKNYNEDQIRDSLLWDKMLVFLTEKAIVK